MSYSIKPELQPVPGADGKHRLRLLVICNRCKVRLKLPIKVMPNQVCDGKITDHPQANKLNSIIRTHYNEAEGKLLDLLRHTKKPTLAQLKSIFKEEDEQRAAIASVQDLLQVMIDEGANTKSEGRIRHYKTMLRIVNGFKQPWPLSKFTSEELTHFHAYLVKQDYGVNTVWSKFNILKAVRTQAVKRQLIKADPFALYKTPAYVQKIPVYITEAEMETLSKAVDGTANETYRQCGYYFLFSCYAGFRIGDLKRFDYSKRIQGDRIIIRTKKTGEIVSVKIHSRLHKVLQYVQQQRLTISEVECNRSIKELAKFAGIHKHLKMHSGRHSFAMLLAEKGVSKEDAMELMGITNPATINVYYRISNVRLDKVIEDKLG